MKRTSLRMLAGLGLSVAVAGVVAACGVGDPGPREDLGTAQSAAFTNGSFEVGAPGAVPPAPWALATFLNPDPGGVTIQTPQTRAGLNLIAQGNACVVNNQCAMGELGTCQGGFCRPSAKTITLNGVNQPDALLGMGASLRWPRYGAQCALVNNQGSLSNVNSLSQTMVVGAADVDPSDGIVHIRFVVAPVLEDPAHAANQQPYFFIQVTNVTQANKVVYTNFNFSNQAGVPWQAVTTGGPGGTTYRYTDWQLVDIAPGTPTINMGDTVELEVIAAGCSLGGHIGQVYVDGVGSTLPGLFVSGTGPAQANAGTNITYNMSYKNGSGAAETGGVIDITLPPNTTFVSFTPPPGAVCMTPPVGGTGTIVCTFAGPIPAGASGTFTLTVAIAAAATGEVVLGTYDIHSNQERALLGSKIETIVGCTADAQCPAADWCHESAPSACLSKLANGAPVSTDRGHNPTLNGTCTAAAAAVVCASGVCDTNDNDCGLRNGDGPCTAATGIVVCRSGVCDPDLNCGFANGDGPCTAANGGLVCRSGACSTNLLCEPAGGCNTDADCVGGGLWCNETTHACVPKLANGTALPSDGAHSNPTLDGTCTAAAAALVCISTVCDTADSECGFANGDGPCTAGNADTVCRSLVCDPDLKCGFANGDGPCTVPTGATVCRSGACTTSGVCEPPGGCAADADCPALQWCDEANSVCKPVLANGDPLPTDTKHMTPTLDGSCTVDAAKLVCASAVCDTKDDECGYANGDGPCDGTTATLVCRSGACSTDGTCEPPGGCNVAGDCGPATPLCVGHMCVTCATDADCAAPTPLCDAGTCVACSGDFMAQNPPPDSCPTAALPVCVTAGANAGICVECSATNNSACKADKPICITAQSVCGCAVDTDCVKGDYCETSTVTSGVCTVGCRVVAGKDNCPTGDTCSKTDGSIGTCGPAGGCDPVCPATQVCDASTKTCVECTSTDHSKCTDAKPVCLPTEVCGCSADSDCGSATSGKVCNADDSTCEVGCRGTGGNSCPVGMVCSSTDDTIGTCGNPGSGGGSPASSTGADMTTSGAGGSAPSFGQIALGGGCSVEGDERAPAPIWQLGLVAGALALLRRRRASKG